MPAAALTCWHLLATAAGMAAGGQVGRWVGAAGRQGGRCCGPVSLSHSPIWCDAPHLSPPSSQVSARCTLRISHLASQTLRRPLWHLHPAVHLPTWQAWLGRPFDPDRLSVLTLIQSAVDG